MPRGNDLDAKRDLANQYGDGHGNAEDLIQHHDNVLDTELQKALSKPVDPAATDALDLSSIKPKYGGTIMSAVIRGGRLVVVEDDGGHYEKWHDDIPGKSGGSKRGNVDSGAQARKDTAVRSQGENPTGNPAGNDGGTGSAGGSSEGDTGGTATGATGSGADGEDGGDASDVPEGVTVPQIREKLGERGITPPREVRRREDLWDLLPEDAQGELAGGTSNPS